MENMEDKLTLKEQKFVTYWTESGNGTEAVKSAGYVVANDNVAANLAWRLLRKAKIQTTIRDELRIFGITPEYRYEKLKNVLNSKNPSLILRALELLWKIDGTMATVAKPFDNNYRPIPILNGISTDDNLEKLVVVKWTGKDESGRPPL